MSMKIANVETFYFYPGCAKNLVFVKITTDDGVYGWGEAYSGKNNREKIAGAYIEAIKPCILGREVTELNHLGVTLFDEVSIRRSGGDYLSAWSAVEIALWDILGKYAKMPVYNMLGGKYRDWIRVYANGWWHGSKDPEELCERAKKVKELGYTCIKFDPFFGPWRNYIGRQREDLGVKTVQLVREALGPDMDLMIEFHRRLSPENAIHFYNRIKEFNPYLVEEPCLSDNVELVAKAKRGIDCNVVSGETLYTLADFQRLFQANACDIINPDTCAAGGITGMLAIASLASVHSIQFSPHNWNSSIVGLAATATIGAIAPNFSIAEQFINVIDACNEIAIKCPKIENGWIKMGDEPGLGVDIDVAAMEKHPYHAMKSTVLSTTDWEFPNPNNY